MSRAAVRADAEVGEADRPTLVVDREHRLQRVELVTQPGPHREGLGVVELGLVRTCSMPRRAASSRRSRRRRPVGSRTSWFPLVLPNPTAPRGRLREPRTPHPRRRRARRCGPARRSDATECNSAMDAAGAAIVARSTGVFCDAFASVLARRMPMSARLASRHAARLAACGRSSPVGHEARCTEPSCHQRPDLFGDEREDRREQAQQHVERRLQRRDGRGLLALALAVGPALHQLEVVVAERQKNVSCPRARGRSRSPRTRAVASSTTSASRRACSVDRLGDRPAVGRSPVEGERRTSRR